MQQQQKVRVMKKLIGYSSAVGLAALLSGCVSQPLKFPTVAELKAKSYEVVGEGEGKATGIMLFACIPIGQNERYVRAYDLAVQSKGGDALIDPTVQEKWFWGYILDGYTTTVTGTVIKYNK
jgi:hypothetical protein